MILTAENLVKGYGDKNVLDRASLFIDQGDKIGVVGVNGTGKSTLLRLIAGTERKDGGTIAVQPGVRISYLPQNPVFERSRPVLQEVMERLPEEREYEAKSILNRLGLSDYAADVTLLSGGQKKRAAIAKALLVPAELLILDEPTNHIDSEMVAWLEQFLQKYTGAVLMVTHDRYFLDRIVNRIVEVSRGKLYQYKTNYSGFIRMKNEREELEAGSRRKQRSFLKRELEWVEQGPRARGTKSRFRLERFAELKEQQQEVPAQKLSMSSPASRLGRKTVEIRGLSKQYGGKRLIENFTYTLLRDDRIGIIGKNGSGKTTLLRLIMGLEEPDAGSVEWGGTVKIGYFSQECEDMDENKRVIDYIRESGDEVLTADGGRIGAAQMLERFLFPPELQWKKIGKLSGGERRRLYLLKIIMGAPNILLLDEPTNDLDIETLMVLEEYLDGFPGAVAAVSHDRYFLDHMADKIFALEGEGRVREYLGGYTDYLSLREPEKPDKKEDATPKRTKTEPQKKLKFTFREQREYETIDLEIAELEQRLKKLEQEIDEASSDFERLQGLLGEQEELRARYGEKEERWLYLHELAERIEKSGQ